MELNVWLNSTIEPNPQYDEATELWSVKVIKDGVVRNMRVGHVVSHFLVSTFRLSHFFSPCTIRLTLALLDRSSLPDSVEKLECLLSLPEANSRERSTTRLNTLEVRSGLERRLWSSDVATLVTTSYVRFLPTGTDSVRGKFLNLVAFRRLPTSTNAERTSRLCSDPLPTS